MQMKSLAGLIVVCLSLACIPTRIQAQADLPKFEVGAQLSILDVKKSVGEKSLGWGGRATYYVHRNVALEGEFNYFPSTPDGGNVDKTQGLFGVKAGWRNETVGIFAKARPGFVRFSGAFYEIRNQGSRNNFAFDLGGVLELYPTRRVVLRFDCGDTIIPFGDAVINTGAIAPSRPGTSHNQQFGFGIGFRF